jgi:cystathionine beta-lyase
MSFDFDRVIDRHGTGSSKWTRFPADVLPMWVADMDFAVAEPIQAAMQARLDHGVFGYTAPEPRLRERIQRTLAEDFGWEVAPEAIVFLPGVVPGFNMALKATCAPGQGVVVQVPVYPPMLAAPGNWALERRDVPIERDGTGGWASDRDRFRRALDGAGAFLLCNPHNPTGKVFTEAELAALAEDCLAARAVIVSDEIHADLVFAGHRHRPIAALAPEIAARTITLMSAGKTYNLAGLHAGWAVIPDAGLRQRFEAARLGLVGGLSMFALAATEAALEHGGPWRAALLRYLEANRDWLAAAVRARMPGVTMQVPQGTYLAWLDCAGLGLEGEPAELFLERARVGLNRGADFGPGGRDCVRLNFGCPRALLDDGVARMAGAIATLDPAAGRG